MLNYARHGDAKPTSHEQANTFLGKPLRYHQIRSGHVMPEGRTPARGLVGRYIGKHNLVPVPEASSPKGRSGLGHVPKLANGFIPIVGTFDDFKVWRIGRLANSQDFQLYGKEG